MFGNTHIQKGPQVLDDLEDSSTLKRKVNFGEITDGGWWEEEGIRDIIFGGEQACLKDPWLF